MACSRSRFAPSGGLHADHEPHIHRSACQSSMSPDSIVTWTWLAVGVALPPAECIPIMNLRGGPSGVHTNHNLRPIMNLRGGSATSPVHILQRSCVEKMVMHMNGEHNTNTTSLRETWVSYVVLKQHVVFATR
jgi:hypothetical protein